VSCTRNEQLRQQAKRSCVTFILVKVPLNEKNCCGSSIYVVLRGTTGSCRGRFWNPVAIPVPCLDSCRALQPGIPRQLQPAGSGSYCRDPESGYYPLATCWCTVSHIGVTGSATGCERIRDVQWYHMRGAAVIFLAISSLLLSSCADFKLPPDQPWSNRYRRPGSGDCTFRCGSELGFWA
jgi:hypothetical protein